MFTALVVEKRTQGPIAGADVMPLPPDPLQAGTFFQPYKTNEEGKATVFSPPILPVMCSASKRGYKSASRLVIPLFMTVKFELEVA